MTKRIRSSRIVSDSEYVPMCCMPGCHKWNSDLPHLHLCNAHLAIVHKEVEASAFTGLLSVDGHHTLAAQIHFLEMELAAYKRADVARSTKGDNGTIYYVQSGGHIKIGWTSDLTKRMRQYPPNCQLLANHPGTRADEQRLHKRFAAHRSHGREWYPLAPVILHHIDMMKTKHGDPDAVAFGAQPVTVPQHRGPQYVGGYPADYGKREHIIGSFVS